MDIASASLSSSGAGFGGQVDSNNQKSYEVTKNIETENTNYIQITAMIVVILVLLIMGYRIKERKK